MRIVQSMGLKVKLPMKLYVDNKGCVDLIHNWNVSGRCCHMDVKICFLRELKDTILVEHKKGEDNKADIFTKNLSGPTFEKHGCSWFGIDKYCKHIG